MDTQQIVTIVITAAVVFIVRAILGAIQKRLGKETASKQDLEDMQTHLNNKLTTQSIEQKNYTDEKINALKETNKLQFDNISSQIKTMDRNLNTRFDDLLAYFKKNT
jgi:mannitol-specific phosphotransferase system IIBC component